MECYKNIGDWIGEGELFAVIYRYDKNRNLSQKKSNKFNSEKVINNNNNNSYSDYQQIYSKHMKSDNQNQKYDDISIIDSIRNAVNIAKDSSLSDDPVLGINLLGEMAIKSNNLRDYDVVNSLIIGLFRILIFGYTFEEKLGLPFTVSSKEPKFQKLRQIKSIKNNSKMKSKNLTKQLETGQKIKERETSSSNSNEKNNKERIIIINPRELKIQEVIIVTLTIISDKLITHANTSSNECLCKQYISTCNYLLENNKVNEFKILTEWYSNRLLLLKIESKILSFCYHYLKR